MQNLDSFITELLDTTGRSPQRLLQYLIVLQHQYAHIPRQAVDLLAAQLQVPITEILGVIDFYAFLHRHSRGQYDILFSDNITDRMLGNQDLLNRMCKGLRVRPGVTRGDARVTVALTSCTGLCDQGPALLVNGMAMSAVDPQRIGEMIELIESETPVAQWPSDYFRIDDNIRRRDLLLHSKVANGAALLALHERGANDMLTTIDHAALRGRGGAGFHTATKWRACKNTEAETRYVICNADEGEPGTFKDRVLLNSYADQVIEGMTLCAGIVGARQGYLYLRGEYRYLLESLEATLQQRRDTGLLGQNIMGHTGFDFDVEIHLGAGAYICGEESALIESLEGKRGVPRNRPPYPVTHGFLNQPTVVNNVETFFAATHIAARGEDWFCTAGTPESTGTKLLSISGDCAQPGIYEYAFGVSLQTILDDCGANETQAVQVSGAAGFTLHPDEFSRSIAFEDVPSGGSFMIFNRHRDMLDAVQNFAHFFHHESCGFCTPCRVGGTLLKDLVEKVMVGHATRYDLSEMKKISELMQHASHCGLGTTAPNIVLDTLEKFPDAYSHRLAERGYEPAFDIDAEVEMSRQLTGRKDPGAYIRDES